MKGRDVMTLQQQALHAVQLLPEEKLPVLIEFARFLNQTNSAGQIVSPASSSVISQRRRALSGILNGQVKMADDFNETPEEFKEYL